MKKSVLKIMRKDRGWRSFEHMRWSLFLEFGHISKNKLKKILRELCAEGYLELHYIRKNGRMAGTEYVLVRKKSWIFNWVFTLIVFALLLSVPNKSYAPDTDLGVVTKEDLIDFRKHEIKNSEFTFELFREYADLVGLPNPEISVRQSVLETGFFTSTIFNENNNLFGMKHPRVRPTKSVGSARGHAVYEHWTDSVEDYVLWYEYMTRNGVYVDYKDFLKKVGYAEDNQYINKLLTINFV